MPLCLSHSFRVTQVQVLTHSELSQRYLDYTRLRDCVRLACARLRGSSVLVRSIPCVFCICSRMAVGRAHDAIPMGINGHRWISLEYQHSFSWPTTSDISRMGDIQERLPR